MANSDAFNRIQAALTDGAKAKKEARRVQRQLEAAEHVQRHVDAGTGKAGTLKLTDGTAIPAVKQPRMLSNKATGKYKL